MMVRLILFLCGSLFISSVALAQNYENALGLRGGLGATATYKHFISTDWAIEGTAGLHNTDNDLYGINATFQKHNDLEGVNYVQWYWGAGLFLAFNDNTNQVGIAGGLGIEWAWQKIPLTFSIDWLPRLKLNDGWRLYNREGGLAIRYIINY